MKQTHKESKSIRELVDLLENPRKSSARRVSQPIVDREEVRKNMRLRWKDPAFCNIEFKKASNLKAVLLSQWEIERINMATRSYKTPKQSKPYRFDQQSRQFPKLNIKLYPLEFQRYIKKVEFEKQDLLFKEKRTKTEKAEGRQLSQVFDNSNDICQVRNFKPVSTVTSFFGFTAGRKNGKRKLTTNSHFKTLVI